MSSDIKTKEDIERENATTSTLPALHKTNGWRVTTSVHARSQAQIRHPNKTTEDWQALHRNIVHNLAKTKDKHNGDHFIHSIYHGHSIIANVNHAKREIHVATILSKGMIHSTHEGDHKIVVESSTLKTFKEFISE